MLFEIVKCLGGGIGSHDRFKPCCSVEREGSSPSLDTEGHFCTLVVVIIKVQLWLENKKNNYI